MLWFRMYRGEQPDVSSVPLVQAFVAENLYFSTGWIGNVTFRVGQVLHLLLVMLFLLIEVRGNAHICASSLRGSSTVKTSGERLAEAACSTVRGCVGLQSSMPRSTEPSTCPASLMLWQFVGAWMVCVALLLKDVLQRRAFLRTSTAKALIPEQHREAAEAWPFSRSAGGALVLWACICFAMFPYVFHLLAKLCLALA